MKDMWRSLNYKLNIATPQYFFFSLSTRDLYFSTRAFHVGFLEDKMTIRQVFVPRKLIIAVCIISPTLYAHLFFCNINDN